MFTTTHLEDANLVAFAVRNDSGCDSGTGHQGCADLEFAADSDCKHLIDHNFLAYVRSNLFYFNFFASSNTKLFATGFYDRVHVDLFIEFRGRISTEPKIIALGFARSSTTLRTICRRLPISIIRAIKPVLGPLNSSSNVLPLSNNTNSTSAALALIAQDMAEVDRTIALRLDSAVPLVGHVSRYIIGAGGKRLRPALLLLMCGALEFKGDARFVLAAVVEFIHTATLLHDDVVDESTLRRGRPTANEEFGNPASVLVGDFLYSRAFQMMVDVGQPRVMQILSDATNVIAEGEVQQLMNMHDASLDEAGYLYVIQSKTAKLFEACAQLGAVLAGSPAEVENACALYGQSLGTAFQVIDDVLDYEGDASEMGKNLGDDLREGKTTLPLIIAMQRASESEKELIKSAIENGDESKLAEIVKVVRATGALDATRDAAAVQAKRAIDAISVLPDNSYTKGLIQLAAQLLERRM